MEKPHTRRGLSEKNGCDELEVLDEVGENVADGRAEQRQDDNDDDGDEDENKGVFDEALAFFTGHVQHGDQFSISV